MSCTFAFMTSFWRARTSRQLSGLLDASSADGMLHLFVRESEARPFPAAASDPTSSESEHKGDAVELGAQVDADVDVDLERAHAVGIAGVNVAT